MSFKLANLETLCSIARNGTFSAAARALNTSQPAVTSRMRELERSVGFPIFRKKGRGVELTSAGRQLYLRVEPHVRQLGRDLLLQAPMADMQGLVRIGTGMVSMSWLPEFVDQLHKEMPLVQFDIEVGMGMDLIRRLDANSIDFAIAAGDIRNPRWRTRTLRPVQHRWVTGKSKAYRKSAGIPDLFKILPFWTVARDSDFFPHAANVATRNGVQPNQVNTCGNMLGVVDMIERTGGIGFVPEVLARSRIKAGTLIDISDRLKPLTFPMSLLTRLHQSDVVVERIIDLLCQFNEREKSIPYR